jgi:hypothetical protein
MKKLVVLLFIFSCGCQDPDFQDHTHLGFIALGDYVNVNKRLPKNITNKEGKPLLSWRVELLKYGGGAELNLYKQFNLDEPWNSPHNMDVALTVPFQYIDPKGSQCTPIEKEPISTLWRMDPKALNYTPYLAVVGAKTAFALDKIPEESYRYAVIVVVDKSDVFWTEPRDISVEKVKKGDCLRWYGKNKKSWYVSPHGGLIDWEKDVVMKSNGDPNFPPKYEFESDN